MRRFLHFTTRHLALLVVAIGALLAVLSPRLRDQYSHSRVENATRRLKEASAAGDEKAVAAAMASGARLRRTDDEFPTHLIPVAIRCANVRVVDALLAAGAHPDQLSLAGMTPLDYAAKHNDVALAKRLLAAGAGSGKVLSISLEQGHVDILRLILTKPPPLHWLTLAIDSTQPAEHKLKVVRLLLEHGAPLTGRTSGTYTWTPMDQVLPNGDATMGDLLREFGAPYTAREAVIFNRLEDVRRMVQENPELPRQRFKAYYHLDNGLDPTLLGLALRHGHRELSQYLLAAGAALDVREWRNETLMHQAVKGGDPELIRELAGCGVAVNAESDDGSPLGYAIGGNRPAVVTTLLELGADAKRPGLLHAAVQQPQVVQQLLAAGADPLSTDHQGKTAIEHARELGQSEVVGLLEKALADRAGSAPQPITK